MKVLTAADLDEPEDTPPPHTYQLDTLEPINIAEVSKLIGKVTTKSCELDPLPAKLTIDHIDTLLPVIGDIVNLSFEESHVPGCLKTAVLRPSLKKPSLDHEIFVNFRPVFNLKMVSKVIEKVVASRLNVYLDKHDLKEPLQSAYETFHSCETALVRVHNDMLRAVDHRSCVALLLLDLSAVDHDLLLHRMFTRFGICGRALDWFRSYLRDRSQFVGIDGFKSDTHALKYGVPQGSVLGPMLYLMYMYMCPLGDILRRHNIIVYYYYYYYHYYYYPSSWKLANVVPLFKSDYRQFKTNYRPVSLMVCLSKICEKVVFLVELY